MRIACLGGGPAGLDFGIPMKLRNADAEGVFLSNGRAYRL